MFRIEFQESEHTTILKIHGRLVERYVEGARSLAVRLHPKPRFIVDLVEMTYADEAGQQLLTWLKRMGAQFVPGDIYCSSVCERLHLPRAKEPTFPETKCTVRFAFPSHG